MDFLNDSIDDLLSQLENEIALTDLMIDSFEQEREQLKKLDKTHEKLRTLATKADSDSLAEIQRFMNSKIASK